MGVTRWQSNAGAREAKRHLALCATYHRERKLVSTIAFQYTAVPLGALIRKKFNGEFFHGRVVTGPRWKYDTVLKADTMCYWIVYNDGDFEDARRDELDLWRGLDVV